MRSLGIVSLLWSSVAIALAQSDQPPEALRNLERYRANLRTGTIDCSEEHWLHDSVAGKDTRNFRYATSRFANEDWVWIIRGDENGVMLHDTGGNPVTNPASWVNPLQRLFAKGQIWEHEEQKANAATFTADRPNVVVPNLRALGVTTGVSHRALEDTLYFDSARQPAPRKYSESVENGLRVVTAETDTGTRRWWIDPERGWNVVRATLTDSRGVWGETRVALKNFDGVWFPETVEHYYRYWRDGREPETTIHVYSARFNRPDDPQKFTPEDIGIEEGMTVELLDRELDEVDYGFYDGKARKFSPIKEYIEKRRSEALAAQGADGAPPLINPQADLGKLRTFESEWEAYVRRFIELYKLDDEQAQKAHQILKDCQEQANSYVSKRSRQIDEYGKRLDVLKGATDKEKRAEAVALADVIQKLCKPVSDIFERQLKPRLERLPTRAQRAATQPAEPLATEKK